MKSAFILACLVAECVALRALNEQQVDPSGAKSVTKLPTRLKAKVKNQTKAKREFIQNRKNYTHPVKEVLKGAMLRRVTTNSTDPERDIHMEVLGRTHLLNSKSFQDVDSTVVHIGDRVFGHFDGNRKWFKTADGKYLPGRVLGPCRKLPMLKALNDTSRIVKLSVRVNKDFMGLAYRKSMNMTDKDNSTVTWGDVVEGRVQPGQEWFQTTDGRYLPMKFQGKPALVPLPVQLAKEKKEKKEKTPTN